MWRCLLNNQEGIEISPQLAVGPREWLIKYGTVISMVLAKSLLLCYQILPRILVLVGLVWFNLLHKGRRYLNTKCNNHETKTEIHLFILTML